MTDLEKQTTPDPIFTRLRSLPGAQLARVGNNEYVVSVTDPEQWDTQWNQNVSVAETPATRLADFWPLIKAAYAPESDDSEMPEQLAISLRHTDKIYVVSDGKQIAGFCSIEQDKSDSSIAIIRDINTLENQRGQGLGKKLYERIFEEKDVSAVISSTTNLASVINRKRIGAEKGFKTVWANEDIEDVRLHELRRRNVAYLKKEDVLSDKAETPESAGITITATNYIPAVDADAVSKLKARVSEGDTDPVLKETLEQAEKLLALQKQYTDEKGEPTAIASAALISYR